MPSGGSSSATIVAGQTASYTLSIGGAGLSGTASLSCTGSPTGANCSVPPSEPFSSTVPATFNLSVTTTSRTVGALRLPAFAPVAGLWIFALLGMVVHPGRRISRRSLRRYRPLTLLTLLLFLCSCGGGGDSGSPQPQPEWNPSRNVHSECEGDLECYGADHLSHIDSPVKPALTIVARRGQLLARGINYLPH